MSNKMIKEAFESDAAGFAKSLGEELASRVESKLGEFVTKNISESQALGSSDGLTKSGSASVANGVKARIGVEPYENRDKGHRQGPNEIARTKAIASKSELGPFTGSLQREEVEELDEAGYTPEQKAAAERMKAREKYNNKIRRQSERAGKKSGQQFLRGVERTVRRGGLTNEDLDWDLMDALAEDMAAEYDFDWEDLNEEELAEVSAALAKRYISRSAKDYGELSRDKGYNQGKMAAGVPNIKALGKRNDALNRVLNNRENGMARALNRLHKEDVDLDEDLIEQKAEELLFDIMESYDLSLEDLENMSEEELAKLAEDL